ncbi:serine hydrolase domain-containing protein [Nocardioides terrisoli]|uniref:serine hydrolase domain-containing protein n=1 Tax=Nocardioides terrisoli TaxID=3388267 RepID=UPI00287BA76D|nr:serine hydrolase domain-containing protein [Nocardioides marmorisolisilvae]
MTGRESHFQAVADAYQAVRRLPTLVVGVLAEGTLVWRGQAGAAADPATQYRIGSITKTMTGVLVMQCRDDGLLTLEDPLGDVVPESAYRAASLRQLLSHTSGMQSEPVGSWWERSPGVDFEQLSAANDVDRSVFAPGTTYHYSNLGFALLGEVVARLRGRPWQQVLAERLLGPLGMARTTYLPAPPYAEGWSVHHLRGTLTAEPARDTGAMAPAGQLWSTIDDLAILAGFLRSGNPAVLSSPSLAEMRRPVRDGYGLATMVAAHPGGQLVGHLGSMPGFQGSMLVDPRSGDGVVALTNATTGLDGVDLTHRLLGSVTPRPGPAWVPTAVVPEWAEELLGYWHWGNSAFEVRWHNGLLEFIDLARGRLAEQFTRRDGRLVGVAGYHAGEPLHVVRRPGPGDGADSVSHLECATFIYTRTPYDPAAPIPGGHPHP